MTDRRIFKTAYLIFVLILMPVLSGCAYYPYNGSIPAALPGGVVQPEEEEDDMEEKNLIPGGDFKETDSAWGLYTESGGSASIGISGGRMTVGISDPGKVTHAVQLYCDGFEMLEGGQYHFSAKISSDTERTFEWRIQVNGGDYHTYTKLEDVGIGTDVREITCDFIMQEPSDPAPRMCFNLGDADRAQGLGKHNIYIDDVTLVLKNSKDARPAELTGELRNVNINQVGYRPDDDKRAVVRLKEEDTPKFSVTEIESGEAVFTGTVTGFNSKGASGDTVGYADFSSLDRIGRYRVEVDGIGESYEFAISDDVYDDMLKDTLRMLYLQRCGCELPKDLAGDFAHGPCHTEDAQIYGGNGYREVTGGWHDAGDYGRYTVPAAKAVADLLLAYEVFPDSFEDPSDIPESGNGIPDVLNEARYELDWLLKMQGTDGGVYHKVTGLNFDGVVMSDECTEKLYLLPESKTATADFAGVMYMASRVYKEFDSDFSDRCIDAADRAVSAYLEHINDRNYVDPEDVLTGEYADGTSADELLWFICEGYKTTGEERFVKLMEKVDFSRITSDSFGWADMSGYAYYAYMTSSEQMKGSYDIRNRFFEMCDTLKDDAFAESYGSTIMDDHPWGSNMTIANNGMALLMAYKLTGKEDYRLAAKRQLDYLFGTNCNSYCFLTGYGTQTPRYPHHRPSQAVGKCMKGMLVGGPDSALDDPYAKAVLSGLPKARCYADNSQTYSCNEVTIYWNSPLCFLIAGLK